MFEELIVYAKLMEVEGDHHRFRLAAAARAQARDDRPEPVVQAPGALARFRRALGV